ncbi:MAG: hypothetical protein OEM63_04060 [Gammaproteobacteria bacterium]|nr:hypothetical protein [Gammaproteobacteria bacterium]
MKKLFSLDHSLEALAALITFGAALGVLQTFIIGKHFVIPTMVLLLVFFFGNLARAGLDDQRWAKHLLFWVFLLMACHTFFALFWAADARPGAAFGAAFYPVYGGFTVIVGGLCLNYAKRHSLLS